jgi:heme exporter protein A
MNNRLVAENLQLWRGDVHVLRGVSLALDAGRCLQVTGPNGAGKTSLLRALTGLLPLESGSVHWRNVDTRLDVLGFHRDVAYLGHHAGLKGDLTASENLRYAVGMRSAIRAEDIHLQLRRIGLPAGGDERLVRHMSAGQQRRVALARVLLMQCPLWLLDEPTSNLDTDGQQTFSVMLRNHLDAGGVAVVATHQSLSLSSGQQMSLVLQ